MKFLITSSLLLFYSAISSAQIYGGGQVHMGYGMQGGFGAIGGGSLFGLPSMFGLGGGAGMWGGQSPYMSPQIMGYQWQPYVYPQVSYNVGYYPQPIWGYNHYGMNQGGGWGMPQWGGSPYRGYFPGFNMTTAPRTPRFSSSRGGGSRGGGVRVSRTPSRPTPPPPPIGGGSPGSEQTPPSDPPQTESPTPEVGSDNECGTTTISYRLTHNFRERDCLALNERPGEIDGYILTCPEEEKPCARVTSTASQIRFCIAGVRLQDKDGNCLDSLPGADTVSEAEQGTITLPDIVLGTPECLNPRVDPETGLTICSPELPSQTAPVVTPQPPPTTQPAPQPGTCPPGQGYITIYDGKDETRRCIPCNLASGMEILTSGECDCLGSHEKHILDKGFRCVLPTPATEGAAPTCSGPGCPSQVSPPSINRCHYMVGEKRLEFDCACSRGRPYPPSFSGISGNQHSQYDSSFERSLNENSNFAICMHQSLSESPGSHLNCNNLNQRGVRTQTGYCFRPEYFQDTFNAWKEAARCFNLNKSEQNALFAMISQESKFHLDAVNSSDPSVGIGQIHYQSDETIMDFKNDKYDEYLSDDNCRQKFIAHRNSVGSVGASNNSSNHMCSATKNPEQGMFFAAAVFKAKQDAVDNILEINGCEAVRRGAKAHEAFDDILSNQSQVDIDNFKHRLTALAYNMGEGNLHGVICSFLAAQEHKRSYTYRSRNRNGDLVYRWTMNLNTESIGTPTIELRDEAKQTQGFWGVVQKYYDSVIKNTRDTHYVREINERAKSNSRRLGAECPSL